MIIRILYAYRQVIIVSILYSCGGFNTPTLASGYVDYENTEVAYENRPINPAVCKLSLRDRLTTEYIYKVSVDG